MDDNFRGLAAFVIAPLVTPFVFAAYFAAQNGWKWDGGLFVWVAVVSYVFVGTVDRDIAGASQKAGRVDLEGLLWFAEAFTGRAREAPQGHHAHSVFAR